ncbi:MAG: glycoside hydrolase family 2 protein, partial [Acidobacteria bacterium]|nr:glycoside hydrolase family 2 protein [Acidobacteriota bacterium]
APEGPFDPRSPGDDSNGYLNGGVGWYRKAFTLPASANGRRVFIEFEGVYMNSEVWLNGQSLGRRPYGYSTFQYELTPLVKIGGETNALAVRAFVQQPSTRWYSGAGIYRHVWLTLTDPVHVAHWGTVVTTPAVSNSQADVRVQTKVLNQSAADTQVEVETLIRDRQDSVVARQTQVGRASAGGAATLSSSLVVPRPHRWSIADPYLYAVENLVKVGGRVVDVDRAPLGIRTIEFTTEGGFLLNGARVTLQGVCQHHDQGPLGAAAYDRAIERQLEILKSMGVNAIRTSHNPPAPKLLELCDRMGFVVMDEAFDEWRDNKTRFGYGQFFDEWSERDLVAMIRRDRNHPSVVMWSIGNEILEQRNAENGEAMAMRLATICRREDPTRPVTAGMNNPNEALKTGFAKPLDLLGLNYNIPTYERVRGIGRIIASETSSNYSSRDEYNLVLQDGRVEILKQLNNHCTSYDLDSPRWGNMADTEFQALRRSPWIAGEFVWTGFDYIGEPTPFRWPNRSSSFGIVDLCGFKKDRFYLYQSQWRPEPMVHLLPHWNWPGEFRGKEIPVWCYTNAESVELFLNGQSVGARDWSGVSELHLTWQVPYEPGTLRAVAKRGGKVVATDEVQTTGVPARIELAVDRAGLAADGQDLAFITARIVDAQGRLCRSDGDHSLKFRVSGPGTIVGVDNGDPTNHEPFKGPTPDTVTHKAFNGLCLAIVRAGRTAGVIRLDARADGLMPTETTIRVR